MDKRELSIKRLISFVALFSMLGTSSLAEKVRSVQTEAVKTAPQVQAVPETVDEELLTVAVIDFQGRGASASDTAIITELVRNSVGQSGKYKVVEKGAMEKVLSEQAFQQTGCTSQECAVKLGRVLNAQKMIVGTYGVFEKTKILTMRLINVETGEVEKSEKIKGFKPAEVDEAVEYIVGKLLGSDTGSWRPVGVVTDSDKRPKNGETNSRETVTH